MSLLWQRDRWFLLGGVVVLLASFIGAYHSYKSWRSSTIVSLTMPECDLLQGPCSSTLETGERIELRIKPTHMPVLTSVQLEVKTEKIPVKKMTIFFKGAEMNMGEFKFELARQREGLYCAQTILPTCIQEQMVWHAVVQVETNHKRYVAPFVLVNQRPVRT